MDDTVELQNRLDQIEEICEVFLGSPPGFPKDVIIKHVIKLAKGELVYGEE